MPSFDYDISKNGTTTIQLLSKLNCYVLISSSSYSSDDYLGYKMISEINVIISFGEEAIKNLRGKRGIITRSNVDHLLQISDNSKILIHLPHKNKLRPREFSRLTRLIFDRLAQYDIAILPIYYHYNNNEQLYDIRIGSLLTSRNSSKVNRNYILAQLSALHINFTDNGQDYLSQKNYQDIIEPIGRGILHHEIESLKDSALVFQRANFQVYICETKDIPQTIMEIGRLREITFRAVEEGTGRSYDLDQFDPYYLQLFIWDQVHHRVVGGYRLGMGEEILENYGIQGVYINKLFKIKPKLLPIIRESIEMGRSFIVEDYQKQRLPLFLLWRGILELLIKKPQYKYLYGPVSISKYYSNISKNLIITFIKKYYYDASLAKLLKPRKPYKFKYKKKEFKALLNTFDGDISHLDRYIEDIEPGRQRLPVLIKQYIKQNAQFIGFNLDPNFSDALDGFVLLNLNDFPESTMEMLKNEKLK